MRGRARKGFYAFLLRYEFKGTEWTGVAREFLTSARFISARISADVRPPEEGNELLINSDALCN